MKKFLAFFVALVLCAEFGYAFSDNERASAKVKDKLVGECVTNMKDDEISGDMAIEYSECVIDGVGIETLMLAGLEDEEAQEKAMEVIISCAGSMMKEYMLQEFNRGFFKK